MLCVKETALKCRQEAFRIIVAIGQRFLEVQQPLEQYFTMLVAGLGTREFEREGKKGEVRREE
jgi:hypothetical protein